MVSKETTLALKTIYLYYSSNFSCLGVKNCSYSVCETNSIYMFISKVNNLQSLSIKLRENILSTVVSQKSAAHGRSTLQVCKRGGWALCRVVPHLTTKERPCHVYSNSMPSRQIIGQTITCHRTTSGFEVES